jgi:predicted ABC-type ATPase
LPDILIIAGPNGAGKTTFAREYLPGEAHCPRFVNADLIAEGLSPFSPTAAAMRAGRIMLQEIARLTESGQDFAFETTLSGKIWTHRIPEWQTMGYHVGIIFLGLPEPAMAVDRVAARVRQGGHGVPEETIIRRFHKGLFYFQEVYSKLADFWSLYDNAQRPPRLMKEESMLPEKIDRDKQLRDIEAALERAGLRAEEIARRTGTPLILWENGKIVEYYPDEQAWQGKQWTK